GLDPDFFDVVGDDRSERLFLLLGARARIALGIEEEIEPDQRDEHDTESESGPPAHGYRLRHQVNTPAPRTAAGITKIESQKIAERMFAVSVSRLSEGSRGLIAIRL